MVRIFCTTNATHALQEISLKKRINFKGFNPLKQLVIFTHGFSENYFEQKSNFMYPAVESEYILEKCYPKTRLADSKVQKLMPVYRIVSHNLN